MDGSVLESAGRVMNLEERAEDGKDDDGEDGDYDTAFPVSLPAAEMCV